LEQVGSTLFDVNMLSQEDKALIQYSITCYGVWSIKASTSLIIHVD